MIKPKQLFFEKWSAQWIVGQFSSNFDRFYHKTWAKIIENGFRNHILMNFHNIFPENNQTWANCFQKMVREIKFRPIFTQFWTLDNSGDNSGDNSKKRKKGRRRGSNPGPLGCKARVVTARPRRPERTKGRKGGWGAGVCPYIWPKNGGFLSAHCYKGMFFSRGYNRSRRLELKTSKGPSSILSRLMRWPKIPKWKCIRYVIGNFHNKH